MLPPKKNVAKQIIANTEKSIGNRMVASPLTGAAREADSLLARSKHLLGASERLPTGATKREVGKEAFQSSTGALHKRVKANQTATKKVSEYDAGASTAYPKTPSDRATGNSRKQRNP